MPSLADFQRALVAHAYGEPDVLLGSLRALPGNASGLSVHAGNTDANLRDALADVFPVVLELVGSACFGNIARRYVELTPSRSANIHEFGAGFADSLAATHGQLLPSYLVDVARLEWAWHESYHAPDEPAFDVGCFLTVPAEAHGQLRFRLGLHCRLVTCRYPALTIWQAHQSRSIEDTELVIDASRYGCVVYRLDNLPRILTGPDHTFLAELAAERTLEEAFDESGVAASALARWIGAGVISGLLNDG